MKRNPKPHLWLMFAGVIFAVIVFLSGCASPLSASLSSNDGTVFEIRVDWDDTRAIHDFYSKHETDTPPLWWEDNETRRRVDDLWCRDQMFSAVRIMGRGIGFYITPDGKRITACVPVPPPMGPPYEMVGPRLCGAHKLRHLEFVRIEGSVIVCRPKGGVI